MYLAARRAGQGGESMHADEAASKGAMISYVKSMCIELAPRGITVNSVAPGWVDTEMCELPFAGAGKAAIAKGIPLGRIAAPRDIASNEKMPLPANRSRNRAPVMRSPTMLKYA
mgnify:CR=1 FL=1